MIKIISFWVTEYFNGLDKCTNQADEYIFNERNNRCSLTFLTTYLSKSFAVIECIGCRCRFIRTTITTNYIINWSNIIAFEYWTSGKWRFLWTIMRWTTWISTNTCDNVVVTRHPNRFKVVVGFFCISSKFVCNKKKEKKSFGIICGNVPSFILYNNYNITDKHCEKGKQTQFFFFLQSFIRWNLFFFSLYLTDKQRIQISSFVLLPTIIPNGSSSGWCTTTAMEGGWCRCRTRTIVVTSDQIRGWRRPTLRCGFLFRCGKCRRHHHSTWWSTRKAHSWWWWSHSSRRRRSCVGHIAYLLIIIR